jgi:hypothetical protein
MKTKPSRAFSLVELSIIILIVGIIIAGVTEGSRLLKQMRLSTARNLTTSSDIRSIENMVLWLDATSETSLTTDSSALVTAKSSGDLIYNWDDQNPQVLTSVKPRFSQATSGARPTYTENGINNIPTLFFDAADDATTGKSIATAAYQSILNPATYTLFIVLRPVYNAADTTYIFKNQSGNYGFAFYRIASSNKFAHDGYNGTASIASSDLTAFSYNTPYISAIYTNGTTQGIYRNGTLQDSDSVVHAPSTSTFIIGCLASGVTNCFDGHISEIIMFDRVLSTEERGSVTKYLGKKYAIAVSS